VNTNGVYIVWSPDKSRAWVGESRNCEGRLHKGHRTAVALGCTWELVHVLPSGGTKPQRQALEADLARQLAACGIIVVNKTTLDAHAISKRTWNNPALRLEHRATMKAAMARMTPQARSERTRKAWITRRAG
jgi:hypothetical protein